MEDSEKETYRGNTILILTAAYEGMSTGDYRLIEELIPTFSPTQLAEMVVVLSGMIFGILQDAGIDIAGGIQEMAQRSIEDL